MQTIIYSFNGILIFQVLFIIMQFIATRQRYYIFYALYLVMALVYFGYIIYSPQIALTAGSRQQALFAELHQWLAISLYVFYSAFLIAFLDLRTSRPAVFRVLRFAQRCMLIYLATDLLVIVALGRPVPEVFYWANSIVVFFMGLWCMWQLIKKPDPIVIYILTGSCCILFLSFISSLLIIFSKWQGAETGLLPFIVSYSGVVLEAIFFMTAFMLKATATEREKVTALELAAAQEKQNRRLLIDMYEMRGKISADLHDQVGSTLYSVSLNSQMAISGVQQNRLTQVTEILSRIAVSTQAMLAEMNDIVWTINPANDSFNKLAERMQQAALQLLRPLGIEPEFDFRFGAAIENLSMPSRKNLYLIYKEAVTNAARHSGLSRMQISCSIENQTLQLIVTNNGLSFNATEKQRGNGLANMQRRAAEMGGELRFIDQPGGGTTVTLRAPLP